MAREEGPAASRLIPLLGALMLAARALAEEPETIVIDVKDPLVRVRAELDLFINGAKGGPVFVVLQRGDCLLAREDLEQAGLAVPGGQLILVDGTPLLSLKSLAPFITFTVDEAAVALRLTAPASLLGRRRLDLRPRLRPEGLEVRWDPSAYLDYAVNAETDGRVGFTFEAGGRLERWLASSTLSGSRAGGWARGLTSAVRDDLPELRRWTLGDAAASGGPLGGAPLLGGAAVAREFSLDPSLVKGSFPSSTVVVDAPSTLEVYVNGSLVRREPVGPGYWDLSNIPAAQGQTMVQTVLRDAFGRERTIDNRFYYSAGVLARGLSDYALAAGFRRESFTTLLGDYGRAALLGRYRVGLSDAFTPGGRFEAAPDLLSGGGSAAVSLPWGEVDGEVALSAAHGDAGVAGLAGWSWVTRRYSTGIRLTAQSARYANLSLEPAADRRAIELHAGAGGSLSRRVSLSADVRLGRWRDAGEAASAALRGTVALGAGASLLLTAEYGKVLGGERGLTLMALLTWSFAPRHYADVTLKRGPNGGFEGRLSTARALGRDTDWGYQLRAWSVEGTDPSFDGIVQGQTSFGRAEVQGSISPYGNSVRAAASGGLVLLGGSPHLSRATDGSFALVQTGGLAGVSVSMENREVGRTRADGTLLVTELQPYYATRLSLRDRDIPLEYDAEMTTKLVAAPLQGGVVVDFGLQRISAVTGRLIVRIAGKEQHPGDGELSTIVDGVYRTSPITRDGRFFLEKMPAGKHVMQAVWRAGSCRAAVTLPQEAPPILDLGDVLCYLDTLDPEGRIPRLDDPAYANQPFPGEATQGAGGGGGGDTSK